MTRFGNAWPTPPLLALDVPAQGGVGCANDTPAPAGPVPWRGTITLAGDARAARPRRAHERSDGRPGATALRRGDHRRRSCRHLRGDRTRACRHRAHPHRREGPRHRSQALSGARDALRRVPAVRHHDRLGRCRSVLGRQTHAIDRRRRLARRLRRARRAGEPHRVRRRAVARVRRRRARAWAGRAGSRAARTPGSRCRNAPRSHAHPPLGDGSLAGSARCDARLPRRGGRRHPHRLPRHAYRRRGSHAPPASSWRTAASSRGRCDHRCSRARGRGVAGRPSWQARGTAQEQRGRHRRAGRVSRPRYGAAHGRALRGEATLPRAHIWRSGTHVLHEPLRRGDHRVVRRRRHRERSFLCRGEDRIHELRGAREPGVHRAVQGADHVRPRDRAPGEPARRRDLDAAALGL